MLASGMIITPSNRIRANPMRIAIPPPRVPKAAVIESAWAENRAPNCAALIPTSRISESRKPPNPTGQKLVRKNMATTTPIR